MTPGLFVFACVCLSASVLLILDERRRYRNQPKNLWRYTVKERVGVLDPAVRPVFSSTIEAADEAEAMRRGHIEYMAFRKRFNATYRGTISSITVERLPVRRPEESINVKV